MGQARGNWQGGDESRSSTHLHALIDLREGVARGALRLDVLGPLGEREEFLVVAEGLLEVLYVAQLLVRLPKLVLRLGLLGGVAARARGREALFAKLERRRRLARALALGRDRLVRDDEVLVGLLRARHVAHILREAQQLLVLLDGREQVARGRVRHAEGARGLRLARGVGGELRDLEALLPKVDGGALIGKAREEVGARKACVRVRGRSFRNRD